MKEDINKKIKLDSLKDFRSFTVPEGYFDEFPGRIRKIIQERTARNKQAKPLTRLIRPQLALAAGFAGLVLLGYFAVRLILNPVPEASQTDADIAEYIEFHLHDFEESQILEVTEEHFFDSESAEIPDEDIIQYLLDENIDESTILEEL